MQGSGIDWDLQPLGEMPDKALAQKLGVTRRAVGLVRQLHGIPPYGRAPGGRQSKFNKEVWDSLPYGEVSDTEIARALGVHHSLVSQHRNRRGIASCKVKALDKRKTAKARKKLEKVLRGIRKVENKNINTEGKMGKKIKKKKTKVKKSLTEMLGTEVKIGKLIDVSVAIAKLKDMSERYPLEMRTVILTPEFCEEIWRTHTSNFRKFYPALGSKLTFAMLTGEWQFNIVDNIVIVKHQERLECLNGQHRIYAIMKSGIPQPCTIVFITPEMRDEYDIDKHDTGKARTTTDVAFNKKLDPNALMIIKALCEQELYGTFSKGLGVVNHHWFLERVLVDNLEQVSGACEARKLGKRDGVNNVFRVALARALYTQNAKRVMEFADQIINMHHPARTSEDSAANLISKYIIETQQAGMTFTGSKMGLKYYLRLEWAIKQFCERKTVTKLEEAPGIGSLLPIDLGSSKLLDFAKKYVD